MKTKLGILGALICSAGVLALPAAARDRSDYRDNSRVAVTSSYNYNNNYNNNAYYGRERSDLRYDNHSDRRGWDRYEVRYSRNRHDRDRDDWR